MDSMQRLNQRIERQQEIDAQQTERDSTPQPHWFMDAIIISSTPVHPDGEQWRYLVKPARASYNGYGGWLETPNTSGFIAHNKREELGYNGVGQVASILAMGYDRSKLADLNWTIGPVPDGQPVTLRYCPTFTGGSWWFEADNPIDVACSGENS